MLKILKAAFRKFFQDDGTFLASGLAFGLLFYSVPFTLLTVSAILVIGRHAWAPFGIAGAVLLMVFVGIHNSWDTVTYIALQNTPDAQRATGKQTEQERDSREPRPSARHEK